MGKNTFGKTMPYVGMNYKKKQLRHYSICSLSRNALLSAEIYRKTFFSAGYRDFLPNMHFSFEVIRQRKLGKTMIEEVHFIVKTIKI